MRGKRPLTERMIERLGSRLKLDRSTIEAFVAYEKLLGRPAANTMSQVRQLTHDTVSLVSDLQHNAILELVRLQEFQPDSRWIARVLGLSVDEVNVALSRLVRLGMLEMTDRNRWTVRTGYASPGIEHLAYVAVQRLMEQVRTLSLRAMGDAPTEFLKHSSTTVTINSARLSEAADLIARFRGELTDCLASGNEADEVYQLEINLFPLTSLRRKKEQ